MFINGMVPDIVFEKFEYDLNESIRVGLYTRSLFMFSENELELLKELSDAIKSRNNLVAMAALSYFTKSITVNLRTMPRPTSTPTMSRLLSRQDKNKVMPYNTEPLHTIKFWNHLDLQIGQPAAKLMFFAMNQKERSTRQVIGPIDYPDVSKNQPQEIKKGWLGHMESQKGLQDIVGWLKYSRILEFSSFKARNSIQHETLLNILTKLNAMPGPATPAARGGGFHQHITMKKTKKHYKVRKDKLGNKYVMQNKQKVYLSSIKGSYLLSKQT
jgi:hypothetical protein